jgi:hypothetical protein
LQRNAESRQKDNKFVKLQSSENKVYQFNPEKIEQVEAEFNGKKSLRYSIITKALDSLSNARVSILNP